MTKSETSMLRDISDAEDGLRHVTGIIRFSTHVGTWSLAALLFAIFAGGFGFMTDAMVCLGVVAGMILFVAGFVGGFQYIEELPRVKRNVRTARRMYEDHWAD